MLRPMAILALLALSIFAQKTRRPGFCERVDGCEGEAQDALIRQTTEDGHGQAGAEGKQGDTGVEGRPRSSASVDYDRIYRVIEERNRKGSDSMT